jgi:hypothetical protein
MDLFIFLHSHSYLRFIFLSSQFSSVIFFSLFHFNSSSFVCFSDFLQAFPIYSILILPLYTAFLSSHVDPFLLTLCPFPNAIAVCVTCVAYSSGARFVANDVSISANTDWSVQTLPRVYWVLDPAYYRGE